MRDRIGSGTSGGREDPRAARKRTEKPKKAPFFDKNIDETDRI